MNEIESASISKSNDSGYKMIRTRTKEKTTKQFFVSNYHLNNHNCIGPNSIFVITIVHTISIQIDTHTDTVVVYTTQRGRKKERERMMLI